MKDWDWEVKPPEFATIRWSDFCDVLLSVLSRVTEAQRVAFFEMLDDHFCRHCGHPQPRDSLNCRCWNDD